MTCPGWQPGGTCNAITTIPGGAVGAAGSGAAGSGDGATLGEICGGGDAGGRRYSGSV